MCALASRPGASAAGVGLGLGEGEVEVRHAAVADPGLLAVELPASGGLRGTQGHRGHVGAGLGLAQRKGGDLLARCHGAQVARLLFGRTGERDGAAAQALHGKRKVGQRRVVGQRLAQDDQRARVQRGQRTAVGCGHAVTQPAGRAQALHPFAARGTVVGFVDALFARPGHEAVGQSAVRVVKERQFEVRGRGQRAVRVGVFEGDHSGLSTRSSVRPATTTEPALPGRRCGPPRGKTRSGAGGIHD